LHQGKINISQHTIDRFYQLLNSFIDYQLPTIKNPSELALELSKRAKLLQELAYHQLEEDIKKSEHESVSSIHDFYEAFLELIKEAEISDCVDAYSQTITYGLFLSKISSEEELKRDNAYRYIPSNIKIIKKIFINITGDELPTNISWVVDEIIDLLNSADIKRILDTFVFEGKHYKDPFIHFYEDFLKEYDSEKRKHLGVYYTPEPVVTFITNSINNILKEDFNITHGFANDKIKVLDFACGTGTFLANSFVITLQEIRNSGLAGIEKEKIKNHLLKNFYGFEILVSPYVIAHIKLGLLLKTENYNISDDERLQVYLTNTLDPSETISTLRGFFKELTHETMMANSIKIDKPILVIMGNPPYSVSSSNKSEWILTKMKDYKKGLEEKNIQPLDDDYIKFIRFAQWKIEENNSGIVGIISNNSYLSKNIHKIMRKSLFQTFDRIFIINLHGNSNIKEKSPDDTVDQNVFDIRVGVSIVLFIKNDKYKDKKVLYKDLWGKREKKYKFLADNNINSIDFIELNPKNPDYLFIPRDTKYIRKYNNFISLTDIFDLYSTGVKTHRDKFIIEFKKQALEKKIESLKSDISDKEIKSDYELNDKLDDIRKYRNKLKCVKDLNKYYKYYNYRPFDTRYIFYYLPLITRHRYKIMKNFEENNIGLISTKLLSSNEYSHVFITDKLTDIGIISSKTSESGYIFPLYIYNKDSTTNQKTLDGDIIELEKEPNFKKEFFEYLSSRYPKKSFKPEEIFDYIYSILHSKTYRKKYQEFLKYDFPKIPFVQDINKFKMISQYGNQLRKLHLMKISYKTNIASFDKSGTNYIDYVKYQDNKIYINSKQYFDNINDDIWSFNIGGYQILDKWLKSRKNKSLNSRDIEKFIKVVNIIQDTITIMNKIDEINIHQ
jgi:predicted helicase